MIEEQVIPVTEKNSSHKTIIILMVLLVLIVFSSLYYIGSNEFEKYSKSVYDQGMVDGERGLIVQMNTDGKIPVIRNDAITNSSSVVFVPIQELCNGGVQ